MSLVNAKNLKRNHPTIGILAGWSTLEGSTPDQYRVSVIEGIQTAARNRGCHILLSWGVRRITDAHQFYPAWPVVSPESDFVPVGPWNTDGLIVFTPLADETRSAYLQTLQAQGFPILFIGTGEQGPHISADSSDGIHQAVAHLAEHGHRRIAFIAGAQTDRGDSETRLKAYHAAVAEYQLEADESLVVWGWHSYQDGYNALETLLATGVKFTAVLSSNDNAAIGAMRAIYDANLHIPNDIAIMGFDDQPNAQSQIPALASVRVPLTLIGEQALLMMADHLDWQAPLQTLEISANIVQRQSCGCISETVAAALNGIPQLPLRHRESVSTEERQEQLVTEMLSVLPASMRFPGLEEIRDLCSALVDAFFKSLSELSPLYFQAVCMNSITQIEKGDKSLSPWQDIISALRREMSILPLPWDDSKTHRLAEDLLHLARAAIGESMQRQSQRHQYLRTMKSLALNTLTAYLSAALSEDQVVDVLNTHLGAAGISNVRVFFFESDGDDVVARSVLLGPTTDAPPLSFMTREFPPAEFYPTDDLMDVALLPLVFQHDVLGYVAFDSPTDLKTCAVVAIQLATTIKIAHLHGQVVELSLTDALTGLYNRRYFELFLKNEVNRSQRFSRSLSVILVDCDRFKEYNDTYGHPAGDEALQQVAKCLLLGRQKADIVARIGGDEFVVVLPETALAAALEVGRKIKQAVTQLSHLKCRISVSIGLVALHNDEGDAESLIHKADLALYESKRKGKNRISFFCNDRTFDENEFSFLE